MASAGYLAAPAASGPVKSLASISGGPGLALRSQHGVFTTAQDMLHAQQDARAVMEGMAYQVSVCLGVIGASCLCGVCVLAAA